MTRPKLVGIISLPIPLVRYLDDGRSETIADVAFDDTGEAWGLVCRKTPLPKIAAARFDPHRFVSFGALPFVKDEAVSMDARDGHPVWQPDRLKQ